MQNINEIDTPDLRMLGNSEAQKRTLIDCVNKINEIIRAITEPINETVSVPIEPPAQPGMDTNGDGMISEDEATAPVDTNGDGMISEDEALRQKEIALRAEMDAAEEEPQKRSPGRPKTK